MAINRTFGLGVDYDNHPIDDQKIIEYINLKLAALGYPIYGNQETSELLEIATPLLDNYREKTRLLSSQLSPVGRRIQDFLDDYLSEIPESKELGLPEHPFILDRHGLARMMSIPPNDDVYETDIVKSYRISQGILHNPKQDRRTTKGVFHVCEGGLPIPDDKKAVPKITFVKLWKAALHPPKELLYLPFTANQDDKAELFVSLFLRPIVVPEVPGVIKEKSRRANLAHK